MNFKKSVEGYILARPLPDGDNEGVGMSMEGAPEALAVLETPDDARAVVGVLGIEGLKIMKVQVTVVGEVLSC